MPLRELIQNARDAVVARRLKQKLDNDWGQVKVDLLERGARHLLKVTDSGVGMSETTLAGSLLDFGTSYWQTQSMLYEHPELAARGFEPTGQFGIGFFSIFLLGDCVKVITRRPEDAQSETRVLEFRGGVGGRIFIRPAASKEQLIDAGTSVEVELRTDPTDRGGLLGPGRIGTRMCPPEFAYNKQNRWSLKDLCAWLAPALDVDLVTTEGGTESMALRASDWTSIEAISLLQRLFLFRDDHEELAKLPKIHKLASQIRPIRDESGRLIGRATLVDRFANATPIENVLAPREDRFGVPIAITAGGFRSSEKWHLCGLLLGRPNRATRSHSTPILYSDPKLLSQWATEQSGILAKRNNDLHVLSQYAGLIRGLGGTTGPLPVFRYGDALISFDDLSTESTLPSEIELVDDHWGTGGGPRQLAKNQLGVSTGQMRAAIDFKVDSNPQQRSSHRFWRQYWPSQWAVAVEAIAKAWGFPLDSVLEASEFSYASYFHVEGSDKKQIQFHTDLIRRPKNQPAQ